MSRESRKILLLTAAFAAMACHAQADENLPSATTEIYACTSISDDSARLACFDESVAKFRSAEETGDVQTVNRQELKAIEREAFGFSMPSLPQLFKKRAEAKNSSPDSDELKKITVGVKKIDISRNGIVTVYLDDGQIWRQIDTTKVPRSMARKAETATIKRAVFGSYLMKLDDHSTTFRVRRLN